MAYLGIKTTMKSNWDIFFKSHAELLGSISNPEAFKIYKEYSDKLEEQEGSESKEIKVGNNTTAVSDSHYDPRVGIVDNEGNVVMPKEQFEKMLDMEGVAVSY